MAFSVASLQGALQLPPMRRRPPAVVLSGQPTHPPNPCALPHPCSLLAPVQPGDRPLCVLNTHLFFHYMAPHIRTMHVWAMIQVGGGGAPAACSGRTAARKDSKSHRSAPSAQPPSVSICSACLAQPSETQEAHAFIEEVLADAELASGPLRGQRPALLFCGDLNSGVQGWAGCMMPVCLATASPHGIQGSTRLWTSRNNSAPIHAVIPGPLLPTACCPPSRPERRHPRRH